MTKAVLAAFPPGVGKTRGVLRSLALNLPLTAVVFLRSHHEIHEKMDEFERLGGTGATRYVGVSEGCTRGFPEKLGYSSMLRKNICPRCPDRAICEVHKNNLSARVIFAPLAAYEHLDNRGTLDARSVIIDEWPEPMAVTEYAMEDLAKFKVFPKGFSGPILRWTFVLAPAVKILEQVATEATCRYQNDPNLLYGVSIGGIELWDLIDTALKFAPSNRSRRRFHRAADALPEHVRTYSAEDILSGSFQSEFILRSDVGELFRGLREHDAVQLHLRASKKDEVSATFKVNRLRGIAPPKNGKLLLLDATGLYLLPVLEALIGKLSVIGHFGIKPDPLTVQHRRWLQNKSLSRRSMLKGRRPTSEGRKLFRRVIEATVEEARDYLNSPDLTVGILTYKPIAQELNGKTKGPLNKLRSELGKDVTILDAGHFGRDERATNAFNEVDVLVVVGDPVPNISDAHAYVDAVEALTGISVDPQVYINGMTAASIKQAHARARAEVRPETTMVVHAGRQLPPEWKPGEFEEIMLPGKRRDAEDIRITAEKMLDRFGVSASSLGRKFGEALMRGFSYKGLSNRETRALEMIAASWTTKKQPRRIQEHWADGCKRAGAIKAGKVWAHPGTTKQQALDAIDQFKKALGP